MNRNLYYLLLIYCSAVSHYLCPSEIEFSLDIPFEHPHTTYTNYALARKSYLITEPRSEQGDG